MTTNARKRTSSDKPTAAERKAMAWHRKHHPDADPDGWWRCAVCRSVNPFDTAGRWAALRDVQARITDSLASTRPPDRKDD